MMDLRKQVKATLRTGKGGDDELLTASSGLLVGYMRCHKAQEDFDASAQKLKEYYDECGNVETLMNNIKTIFDNLVEPVIDAYIQDLIDSGMLGIKKTMLTELFEATSYPLFNDGLAYITDFWFDTTLNTKQKEAYREYRKQNRARGVSVGFGMLGGLKAEISSGLGNIGTGLAHSAFNAIANGIGSIAAESKLNKFYANPETFNALLEGWKNCYWDMYDQWIKNVVSACMPDGAECPITHENLVNMEKEADNHFANLQRANLDKEKYIEEILTILINFPLYDQAWSSFFEKVPELYKEILSYAKQVQEIIPDFYDRISSSIIVFFIMIMLYTSKEGDAEMAEVKKWVIRSIRNDLKQEFIVYFPQVVAKAYEYEKIEYPAFKALIDLLADSGIDIEKDLFEKDEDFRETFSRLRISATKDFYAINGEEILEAAFSKNEGMLAEICDKEAAYIYEVWVLSCIMENTAAYHMEKADDGLLDFIVTMNEKLGTQCDLNDLESFGILKKKIAERSRLIGRKNLPVEIRIKEFYQYMNILVKEYGAGVLGKHVSWGNFDAKVIKNIKKNYTFNGEIGEILALFVLSSEFGLVITSVGLHSYSWSLTWKQMIEICTISLEKASWGGTYLTFSNRFEGDKKFKNLLLFDEDKSSIDPRVLCSIINTACTIFDGKELEIEDWVDPLDVSFRLKGSDAPVKEEPKQPASANDAAKLPPAYAYREYIAGACKNDSEVLGSGVTVYYNDIPSKKLANITKALSIPEGEQIFFMVDDTIMGSAKTGLVLTDWGVRHKAFAEKGWGLSWQNMEEMTHYAYNNNELILKNGPQNNFTDSRKIELLGAPDYELLYKVIANGIFIFTDQ
jgi:hypothetical protein